MFTTEQIKEKLSQVRTGADFPTLAANLKNIGVTFYETRMEDGRSLYHGENGYELFAGPNYTPIAVADKTNLKQLKNDIADHQQGKSDYFQISRQCADNGIEKWAVCLISMTCTYIDKAGNKVWVEAISVASNQKPLFTLEQIKTAHSRVKSGADFPNYVQEIKLLGLAYYEHFVADGHAEYHAANGFELSAEAKWAPVKIADTGNVPMLEHSLKIHQQGQTDYLTFCRQAAEAGVEKWVVDVVNMTCIYYDKAGNRMVTEPIPGS